MASSILLKNIDRLRKSLDTDVNYVDINYNLTERDIVRRGLVPTYGDAEVVAYILWLRSMPGDYIRRPEYGGFFRSQLNRYPFSPASEESIAADLKDETAQYFPFIDLLKVEVKCLYEKRTWAVTVAVRDKETGFVGSGNIDFNYVGDEDQEA
jgi:phage baseplate assembly protein W